MEFNSENLSSVLSKANAISTAGAEQMLEANAPCSKTRPFTVLMSSFLSAFFKNKNKLKLRKRLVYSAVSSFTDFITYLKLLKLKKVI